MCPFSGFAQFIILLITLLLACHVIVVRSLTINFKPNATTLNMYDNIKVNYEITEPPGKLYAVVMSSINNSFLLFLDGDYLLYSKDKNIAYPDKEILISNQQGSFNITGNFLGK